MMASFTCPHNDFIHISGSCPISECPFHVEKVKQLFIVEDTNTNCVFYDTDLMSNVSTSRTQISALSRDKRRLLSPKAIRGQYEDATNYVRSLYYLTHSITEKHMACKCCGYPQDKYQCTSPGVCKERVDWTNYVISLYRLESRNHTRQLIWELFLQNKLHVEYRAKELGASLCTPKDFGKIDMTRVEVKEE